MFRRLLVTAAFMTLLVSAGATAALAAESEVTTVRPIEFTIPAGQCPNLPADLSVSGQGTERTTTEIEVRDADGDDDGDRDGRRGKDRDEDEDGDRNGNRNGDRNGDRGRDRDEDEDEVRATEFTVFTIITGTATDNQGGSYRFSYHNRVEGSAPGTGVMTDHFRLTGQGRANGLFSAFKANLTFAPLGDPIDTSAIFNAITGFEFVFAVGDPFNPATNASICDPL